MELWLNLQNLPEYLDTIRIIVTVLISLSILTLAGLMLVKMKDMADSEALLVLLVVVLCFGGLIGGTMHYHTQSNDKAAQKFIAAYILETENIVALSPIKYYEEYSQDGDMRLSSLEDSTEAKFTGVNADGETVDVTITWLPLNSKPVDGAKIPVGFEPVTIKVTPLADSNDNKDT